MERARRGVQSGLALCMRQAHVFGYWTNKQEEGFRREVVEGVRVVQL